MSAPCTWEEVVRGTGEETGTTVEASEDKFGYRWIVLRDPDVEDLVVGIHAVNDAPTSSEERRVSTEWDSRRLGAACGAPSRA